MGKKVDDSVLNAALDLIATANRQDALSGEPADRAAVIAGSLAQVAMAGGDFTQAAGDTAPIGRKTTVAAKSSVPVTATGTADHVSLIDATTLIAVTTATPQGLTNGNQVNFSSYKYEFRNVI